jgi:subtilisin family serine protease
MSVLTPASAATPQGDGKAQGAVNSAARLPGPDGTAAAAGKSDTITLVTGDVVRVSGEGKDRTAQVVTDVEPRGDVQIVSNGDDLFALPGVAAPLLAAGQLDVRLFNLSLLVRDGYTDGKTKQLPVIVDYQVADGAQPPNQPMDGAQIKRRMPAAGAVAMGVDKKQGTKFWAAVTEPKKATGTTSRSAAPLTVAPQIKKVWLDGKLKTSDDVSRVTIGANKAWAAGFDGAGVPVAVLDTGIDANHPDLAGKVIEAQNFVPADQPGGDSPADRYGHGTHVASIIAGTGAKSGGKYAGVAPKASLFNGKVLSDDGSGYDSWIIAGMEWAASKAKVVNMSLGGCCSDGTDPLAQALNEISRRTGALFVTAAGNNGPENLVVGTPAVADEALAVAAASRDGAAKAVYSSMGPRRGDFAIKPEISAPGSDIIAASANNGDNVICRSAPWACDGNGYMRISGTSMATPHVAAAAAILRQQHPDWTARQVRDALTSTAKPYVVSYLQGYIWEQGAGVVNVGRAVTQKVRATGIVNLGVDEDPPGTQTGTITYTNSGDAPVTLDLASEFWRPNGEPTSRFRRQASWTPPAGAVRIEPARVTVPAGATASATITVDNSLNPIGSFYGRVTATGPGDVTVTTALGFTHDVKHHRLAVNATTMDGGAPDPIRSAAYAKGSDWSSMWVQYFGEGWWSGKWVNLYTGELGDLPADTYRISGSALKFIDQAVAFAGWTVQLDQDRELRIDTRSARKFQVRTGRPSISEQTWVRYADGEMKFSIMTFGGFGLYQLLGPQPNGLTAEYASVRVPQPLWLRTPDGRLRVPALLPQDWASIYLESNGLCFGCRTKFPSDGPIALVDAGDGSPGALAGKDLRGKVALIREKPRTEGEPELSQSLIDDEVRGATTAGAVGVVFAVDAGSPYREAAWDHKIWVTVVSTADGAALANLARTRPARLLADADAPASFDYRVASGPAPAKADPVYQVPQNSLAAVTTHFHASYPGQLGNDTILFPGIVRVPTGSLPLVRTEYVMPAGEKVTGHCAAPGTPPYPAACMWYVAAFRPALRAGQQVTRELMKAPMVPQRVLDHPFAVNSGGGLAWDNGLNDPDWSATPVLGAGQGTGGLEVADAYTENGNKFTNRTRVYRGDAQVCDTSGFLNTAAAGCQINQAGRYRIALDTTMSTYPLSTRTSTEWSLNWNPDPAVKIPLVMPEYRLPVDLNNAVAADEHEVQIQVGYQRGGPAAPAKWAVKVWATFDDGATWQPVFDDEVGPDGLVEPKIKPPKNHNGFVGLRIKADDGQGNGIDQSVIRAYYLKNETSTDQTHGH